MTTNLKRQAQPKQIYWTNGTGADVESGDLVELDNNVGVAAVDIDNGDSGIVLLEGVFELTKDNTQAVTQMAKLYWNTSGSKLTTTEADNAYVGLAYAAAAETATVAQVMLNAFFVDTVASG